MANLRFDFRIDYKKRDFSKDQKHRFEHWDNSPFRFDVCPFNQGCLHVYDLKL